MRKLIFLILLIPVFPIIMGTGITMVQAQTGTTAWTAVKTVSSPPQTKVLEATITFASDSLKIVKMGAATILTYVENIAAISIYATGTVKNFRITTYLTNYYSADTVLWNISQAWDTTGLYTGKPVNDTLNLSIAGLPFHYGGFIIRGLAGNRKDVILYLRAVLRAD